MAKSTIKLASGYEMPIIGLGTWKTPRDETADAVYNAIKAGYRLIDGAYDYQNEKEAGEGIRRAIADGLVKRSDVFVTTKLWNNYHRRERAIEMAKAQNEAWGLGYIDLYLMHFPVANKFISPETLPFPGWWMNAEQTVIETDNVPIRETWEAMESIVDMGIARSIGVSNFQAQSLYDIKTYARHPLSVLQIEHHPYLAQLDLVAMAKENGTAVTAYTSLGPQSFLEMTGLFSKRAVDVQPLLQSTVIKSIADNHKRSPAQVLLRWSTQNGIAVIPKATLVEYLKENLESLNFDLTEAELETIDGLDRGLRFNDPGFYLPDHPLRIFA